MEIDLIDRNDSPKAPRQTAHAKQSTGSAHCRCLLRAAYRRNVAGRLASPSGSSTTETIKIRPNSERRNFLPAAVARARTSPESP
jgi:hypothetical protein